MDVSLDDRYIKNSSKIYKHGAELVPALVSTKETVPGINAEAKDHSVQDWTTLTALKHL